MVAVVTGNDGTGVVRFTFPENIQDGTYSISLRVQYPPEQHTTTFEWRDGLINNSSASVNLSNDWTVIQMGDKAKNTYVKYGCWTWVELTAQKQFCKTNAKQYYIDIKDNNKLMYNFVYIDQVKLVKTK
jgi:hypothetical protein